MDADKAREVLEKLDRWGFSTQAEFEQALFTGKQVIAALTTARTDALREAAEKLETQAAVMEGPHIVQDATAKAMATATRDCASIVRSLIGKEASHG